ncbi:tetratricopeptide repeat protein [uncultured Bifidobacterium sp.]|uniref:tetratricopeptide repeat protein n=1 Tax=uncultured Bifidobacterium sp. TaxID=165187 RepID=UPI002596587C|nr:tetratricopeptide repeat protein [uncultured Bifidobacterium sp.]
MDQDPAVIKLPLFSKTSRLAAIPGQPEGVTYGVVWDACRDPEHGFGYVAELLPGRRARLLAWLAADGKVYSCDRPLTGLAGLRPSLELAQWQDRKGQGAIRVPDPNGGGQPVIVGEYQTTWDKRYGFVNPTRDPGRFFLTRNWELRYFLAVSWLTFVHIPQTQGIAAGTGGGRIGEVILGLLDGPLPDALDALIWRGTAQQGQTSGFERFAARQLVEAGAADVRAIAAAHNVTLVRLGSTSLFWLRFDDDVSPGQRATLLAVEATLNRLWFVEWAAGAADGGTGMLHAFDERFCAQAAQGALREISRNAGAVAQRERADNPYRTIRGAEGARGGIWDVSTRFVDTCERLKLPFRLEYRFDTDLDAGVMAVRFTVPSANAFPASRMGERGWYDARAGRPACAAAYAIRLAGLMAQVAFASSVRVMAVDVTAHEDGLAGRPLLSLGFDRTPFLMEALPPLKDGRLDNPIFDDDPLAVLNVLKPVRHAVRFAGDRGLCEITPLPVHASLAAKRQEVWRDRRPLPEPLRGLLRADTVAELDVMHDDAVVGDDEVRAILEENEESPLIASVQLEAVLSRIGEIGLDEQGRLPLYCAYPMARLIVSLDSGMGAGSVLPDAEPLRSADTRYWKAPDAAYGAHLWLSRFARQEGDADRGLAEALQCLSLAPTTARAYIEVAVCHAEQEQYAQAAETLTQGLRVALLPGDFLYMYYRLAYALWRIGRTNEAVACYTMVLREPNTALAETARGELAELRQQIDDTRPPMAVDEAEQVLHAANIPVSPTGAALDAMAAAAVGLTDAGVPMAAHDAVWLMSRHMRNSDVYDSMAASLRDGVADRS